MSRLFIFADEAGCLEFARKPNVSKYFVLTTVSMADCQAGHALTELRRDLAWRKLPLGEYFHAAVDKQAVRDEVFKTICKHDFHVQATVMEKSKAFARVRQDRPTFYQYGWYYHFKFGTTQHIRNTRQLMVVTASLGTRKERAAFEGAVHRVLRQTMPDTEYSANFCPAAADPCLQIADYCAWAIQRKWESPNQRDVRSYKLIEDRITYEYDLWERGAKHHY